MSTGWAALAVGASLVLGGAGGALAFRVHDGLLSEQGWAVASAGLDCVVLLATAIFSVTIVRSARGLKLWFAPGLTLLTALRGALATAWHPALVAVMVLNLSALGLACALARRRVAVGCIIVCAVVLMFVRLEFALGHYRALAAHVE